MIDIAREKRIVEQRIDLCRSYAAGCPPSQSLVPDYIRCIIGDALTAGYRVWRGSGYCESNPFLLAKFIESPGRDRLYQVAIDVWDLGIEFSDHRIVNAYAHNQFSLDRRRGPGSKTVDVKMHVDEGNSLADIEKFFAEFYSRMGAVPYETADER